MFPEICTERFLLRKIIAADQEKIFEGLSHPDIIQYYGVAYSTMESTRIQMDFYNDLLINETGIWWAICNKDDPSGLIGACGFNDRHPVHNHMEIGYWLLAGKEGAGIMSECIPHIIRYAFENMAVHRIVAVIEVGNEKSIRLITRLGFIYEGTHMDCEIKNGRFISLHYYALLNRKP